MNIKKVCENLCGVTLVFRILGIVGLIAGVICLVVGTGNDAVLAVVGVGSVISSAFLLGGAALFAALGQLVEDVHGIKEKME